jgi:hypothetical protein
VVERIVVEVTVETMKGGIVVLVDQNSRHSASMKNEGMNATMKDMVVVIVVMTLMPKVLWQASLAACCSEGMKGVMKQFEQAQPMLRTFQTQIGRRPQLHLS